MPTTITPDQIEQRMTDALVEFGPEREQIKRDATFEALDVDSLDLAELSQIIEDEYGVQLKGEDVAKIKITAPQFTIVSTATPKTSKPGTKPATKPTKKP